jgi:hypothetical protein
VITPPTVGGTQVRAIIQPISGNFDVRARFRFPYRAANYRLAGLIAYNSGNGKALSIERYDHSTGRNHGMRPINSTTSISGQLVENGAGGDHWNVEFFRLTSDGTTVNGYISHDGIDWWQLTGFSQAIATHLSAITHVGLYVDNENGSIAMPVVFDWFRRYA